jgi:hypothetical protein
MFDKMVSDTTTRTTKRRVHNNEQMVTKGGKTKLPIRHAHASLGSPTATTPPHPLRHTEDILAPGSMLQTRKTCSMAHVVLRR